MWKRVVVITNSRMVLGLGYLITFKPERKWFIYLFIYFCHIHLPFFCFQGPRYIPGLYPHYSEGGHALPPNPPYPTGQSLHPSPQAEAWAHSGAYAPSQQQWQPGQQPPQNHYGSHPVRPAHPPAWPGTGTGAPPPYQPKVQIYSHFRGVFIYSIDFLLILSIVINEGAHIRQKHTLFSGGDAL